jgi:hypothetical protein
VDGRVKPGHDENPNEKGGSSMLPPKQSYFEPSVIPGREANPESRDSGFDASHRPGMT